MHSKTTFLAADPLFYVDKDQILAPQSPLIILTQLKDNFDDPKYSNAILKRQAGLYHFEILLLEREYLAALLHHIQENLSAML